MIPRRKERKNYPRIILTILLIGFILAGIGFSFAWFTDRLEQSSSIKMGSIALDVSGESAGEDGLLNFKVTREKVETSAIGKIMPGDTIEISLNIGLKETSQSAYYILKLSDENNLIFSSAYYFGVKEDGKLVLYQTDGETSWEDGNEENTTTQKLGKLTYPEIHNVVFKSTIAEDYTIVDSSTAVTCEIFAIQQANLTEEQALTELFKIINGETQE